MTLAVAALLAGLAFAPGGDSLRVAVPADSARADSLEIPAAAAADSTGRGGAAAADSLATPAPPDSARTPPDDGPVPPPEPIAPGGTPAPQLPPAPTAPPVGTPPPAERPPAVYGATAELGFTSQSGNTNRMDTAFKLRATRVTPISTLALSGSVVYGEARHVKSAQELSGGLNYDYYPWRRLSLFGFLIDFNNPFQDLRSRWSLAAGARYDVIKHERGFLALSSALLREREEFSSDRTVRQRFRFSWRDKAEWKITPTIKLTNLTFLVQSFARPWQDYRLDSNTELLLPIGKVVALKQGFDYHYTSRPRPGVLTTDRKFFTALVVTLK